MVRDVGLHAYLVPPPGATRLVADETFGESGVLEIIDHSKPFPFLGESFILRINGLDKLTGE